MRDSEIFDQAIETFFAPIARKVGLPLSKIRDGVYEIPSPYFIMRIRLDTGHARGLNVILREASHSNFDEGEPFIQFGIGCFMQFHGKKLEETFIEVNTNEDFLRRARLLAEATEQFGIPYLLGQGNDFDAVREMVKKGAQADIEEIKKYHFPKSVREEWT